MSTTIFRKNERGDWCVWSPGQLSTGAIVEVETREGELRPRQIAGFECEMDHGYLYRIGAPTVATSPKVVKVRSLSKREETALRASGLERGEFVRSVEALPVAVASKLTAVELGAVAKAIFFAGKK